MKSFSLNNLTPRKITLFLFALNAFLGLEPYFVWNSLGIKAFGLWTVILLSIFFLRLTFDKKNGFFFLFFIVLNIYFHAPGSLGNQSWSFGFFSVSILFLLNDEDKITVYRYFRILFFLSLIPGLVWYVADIIGIPHGYSINKGLPHKAAQGFYYREYLGAVAPIMETLPLGSSLLYRFCSMYDEPGVVGTVSVLLLITDNYDLKKNINRVFFFSGFISFSFAFFVISVLFGLLSFSMKKRLIFIGVLAVLYVLLSNFFVTKFLITDRFRIEDGRMMGDNRTSQDFDKVYRLKVKNADFEQMLFGYGTNAHIYFSSNVSSWKIYVLNKGYFGFTLLVIYLVSFAYLNARSMKVFILILLLYLSIYQRPAAFSFDFIILMLGGIVNLNAILKPPAPLVIPPPGEPDYSIKRF